MRRFSMVSVLVSALLLVATSVRGTDPSAKDVDAIFADYDNTTSPGCSLGVIRDGELIYKRGYGMANLEYGIALSPRSVFRTGSVGKQFTAMAIAILAEQGEISLDDPLSNLYPDFPDWADDIRIRNLVHHNSGIRDYLTLTWLAGLGDDDFFTDEFALDLIARQKHLNFQPGEEYLYSNSGYLLLAHIVKRVTGKSLREWAAESVFGPLGMTNTHFHDDHTHIVRNRASGYAPTDGGYRISMTTLDMVGDGGVYTTIEDLVLWDRNFYDNKLGQGGPTLIERVTTPGVFNSGDAMVYAFGLDVDAYRGLKAVSHGGSFVGFRADSLRFPEQRLSVFVLCNRADANPGQRSRQIAALYLGDLMDPEDEEVDSSEQESRESTQPSTSELERHSGHYWSAEEHEFLEIEWKEGALYLTPDPQEAFELVPHSADRFTVTTPGWSADLTFDQSAHNEQRLTLKVVGRDEPVVYERFDLRHLNSSEMKDYTGTYYSEELDVEYILEDRDDALRFAIDRWGDYPLAAKFGETFYSPDYGILTFQRGFDSKVTGFFLDAGRVTHLEFTRR